MQESEQAAFPVQDDSLGIGLTKREYAAIAILNSLLIISENTISCQKKIVGDAIAIADELFTQLGENDDQTAP